MIVVSFFTHESYEAKAGRLFKSLQNMGLRSDIQWVPDQGSWQKNTHMKASFILERISEHGCPVLWVDADAVVLRPLELFLRQDADVMVYRYSPNKLFKGSTWHNEGQLWNGTAYFSDSPLSISILHRWDEVNKEFPGRLEQKNLATVLAKSPHHAQFACLPPEYCWVERVMRRHRKDAQPVILHEAERLSGTKPAGQ